MIDSRTKFIPALVHKNISNDFEINIYNFPRNVKVNQLRSNARENSFDKVAYEVRRKLANGDSTYPTTFVSSIYIQPKMKVVSHQEEIEIRHQPLKKTIYRTSVSLFRRFELDHHPFIEILGKEHENNNLDPPRNFEDPMVWETTAFIEMTDFQ